MFKNSDLTKTAGVSHGGRHFSPKIKFQSISRPCFTKKIQWNKRFSN